MEDREWEKNVIQRIALGDGFRRVAKRVPDKTAIMEPRKGEDLKISYRELNDQLNRFVRAMRELGLQQGDKIACAGPNSIEFAVALYGCYKGGFVFVPVNFMLQPEGMLHILHDSGARAFVFDDALAPVVEAVVAAKPLTVQHYVRLPIIGTPVKQMDNLHDFDEILARQSEEEIEDVIIWERDIAEISYTSGSTADPKGVMLSHLNMYIPAIQTLVEMADHIKKETIAGVMALPIFHAGARCMVNSFLFFGASVVFFRTFDPLEILQGVERLKISFLGGLPMMWRGVFFHPDAEKYDTSSVIAGVYGMAPMDENTLDFLIEKHGIALYLNSGQTEFFPPTDYRKPEWQQTKQGNYWGAPGIMVETAIMDDEGNLLPPGEIGEIVWRGPACMEGYYRKPEATEESRRFGWHHSGDIGFIDEDGLLKFLDRKKDMIKSGGENVSSIKVEETLLSYPRVQSGAVAGLPHERWTEAVTAFVVTGDQSLKEEDIISFCKQKLAAFEVPKKVVFVDSLPMTSTGKVRKVELREAYKDLYTT